MTDDSLELIVTDGILFNKRIKVKPNNYIGFLNQYFNVLVQFYYSGVKLENHHSFAYYGINTNEEVYVNNPFSLTQSEIQEEINYNKKQFENYKMRIEYDPKAYRNMNEIVRTITPPPVRNNYPIFIPSERSSTPSCEPLPVFF